MKNHSNRPNAKELSDSEAGTSLPNHSSDYEVENMGKDLPFRKSDRAEEPLAVPHVGGPTVPIVASPLGEAGGVKYIPGTEIVIGGPTQQ